MTEFINRLLLTVALVLILSVAGVDALSAGEVFGRFKIGERVFFGKVEKERVVELTKAPWNNGVATKKRHKLSTLQVLSPSEPRTILGIAGAYKSPDSNPPKTVRWFAKSASGAAASGDAVVIPPTQDALKAEVEMVIVIGKRVKDASLEEAENSIFGYTAGTEIFGFVESYQRVNGEDPARAESMLGPALKLGDNFAPFGPFIHTGVDWKGRARNLWITTESGEERVVYKNSTDGLLYTPAKIVSDISRVMTLEPGDVVFSGTSKAIIAYPGETIVIEVGGLGTLRNKLVKE